MSTNQQTGTFDIGEAASTDDIGLQSTRSRGANYSRERARPGLPSTSAKRLAKGLGWFSIGLGLAELLAPRAIANISGVSNKHTGLIRLYGLRELGAGITIFAQEHPTEGVWSRVVGDALDLTSLGIAAGAVGTGVLINYLSRRSKKYHVEYIHMNDVKKHLRGF